MQILKNVFSYYRNILIVNPASRFSIYTVEVRKSSRLDWQARSRFELLDDISPVFTSHIAVTISILLYVTSIYLP